MSLISREELLKRFDNIPVMSGLGLEPVIAMQDVKEIIKAVPEVDAVPVVPGMWIHPDEKEDGTVSGRCSHCGWEAHYYEDDVADMPYCPNCGTKMDLEEQDAADAGTAFEDRKMYYSNQSFRDVMKHRPTIDAVPLDKLCTALAENLGFPCQLYWICNEQKSGECEWRGTPCSEKPNCWKKVIKQLTEE